MGRQIFLKMPGTFRFLFTNLFIRIIKTHSSMFFQLSSGHVSPFRVNCSMRRKNQTRAAATMHREKETNGVTSGIPDRNLSQKQISKNETHF